MRVGRFRLRYTSGFILWNAYVLRTDIVGKENQQVTSMKSNANVSVINDLPQTFRKTIHAKVAEDILTCIRFASCSKAAV